MNIAKIKNHRFKKIVITLGLIASGTFSISTNSNAKSNEIDFKEIGEGTECLLQMPLGYSEKQKLKDQMEPNMYPYSQKKISNVNKDLIIKTYTEYFSDLKQTYKNEEFLDEYVKDLNEHIIQEKNYKSNEKENYVRSYNKEELINRIRENSNKFADANGKYYSAMFTGNSVYDSNWEKQLNVEIGLSAALDVVMEYSNNENLSNLSIVYSDQIIENYDSEYNPKNNTIIIYYNMLGFDNKELCDSQYGAMKTLLISMINMSNVCNINSELDFNEKTVFTPYPGIVCLGSSWSILHNLKIDYNYEEKKAVWYDFIYNYKQESGESLLFLLGLCNDKFIDSYYDVIFNSKDIYEFYELFGLESQNDINDFQKLLYVIDGIFLNNSYGVNILSANGNSDIISISNLNDAIGPNYLINIYNRVLKNMIQYTGCHKDFRIDDNIYLLKEVQNILVNISPYYNESDNYNKLINGMEKSANLYLEFLSNYHNVSREYIDELYNDPYLLISSDSLIGNSTPETRNEERFPVLKSMNFDNLIFCKNYEEIKEKYQGSYNIYKLENKE